MMKKFVHKTIKALRRPDLVRNRILGALNYWPVSRLSNQQIKDMPTFCISMRSSRKRRTLMQRQADSLGLAKFEFVDAVEAGDLDISQLARDGLYCPDEAHRLHGCQLSSNEIACSLSHARVYDRIVRDGLDFAMVVEDDALFLPKHLNDVRLSELPCDLDIVFLHAFLTSNPLDRKVGPCLYEDWAYGGSSAAYIVTRSGAHKLSQIARPVILPADGLLGRNLILPIGASHEFRQIGARTELAGLIFHPSAALNGSTCDFFDTSIGW